MPMHMSVIVSSDTPAWKKAPVKSPFCRSWVSFRKPSVLSLLLKSALAQIMFGTCRANTFRQADDAARVAESGFSSTLLQSTFGARPENHSSISAFFSGLALAQAASSARRPATICISSSLRLA